MLYTEDFSMRHYVGFLQIGAQMTTKLSVVKSFTQLCKVPSKVSVYGSFSLKIAGLVEDA